MALPYCVKNMRMRLLHTSDWHLGQHFMGRNRQAEHQALIDWLVETVDIHNVDAVLIAGDLFDTGTPPSYAREQYNQLVLRLHAAGVGLLLLGGNHDSPATLGESRALLARLGTTVVPSAEEAAETQVVELCRRDGTPGCIVCAIPFIRPRDVMLSEAAQSAEEKALALQTAIRNHYQAVYDAARARQATLSAQLGQRLPIVATGHLTTVGASASESVREIYVGSLAAFPTSAFPPADYIALGHIHRPQQVGGLAHIRYSGSPLPLSFDETTQAKEMVCVDFDADGVAAITPLPVPCFRPLAALRGTLDALRPQIVAAARAGSEGNPVWLEVCVVGDDYLPDLQARVEALAEGLPVEVLRVRRLRDSVTPGLTREATETLDELDPHQVFDRRLDGEALDDTLRAALTARYREVVAGLLAEDA